jgi:hypothetical protein
MCCSDMSVAINTMTTIARRAMHKHDDRARKAQAPTHSVAINTP